MEFISSSASTIYNFYTTARRRIALDAIVERLVNNVVTNARVFIGDLSKLEPDIIVMDSAVAAFDEWANMCVFFRIHINLCFIILVNVYLLVVIDLCGRLIARLARQTTRETSRLCGSGCSQGGWPS
jgi:hypothetical protein